MADGLRQVKGVSEQSAWTHWNKGQRLLEGKEMVVGVGRAVGAACAGDEVEVER